MHICKLLVLAMLNVVFLGRLLSTHHANEASSVSGFWNKIYSTVAKQLMIVQFEGNVYKNLRGRYSPNMYWITNSGSKVLGQKFHVTNYWGKFVGQPNQISTQDHKKPDNA